ncbi:MAG: MAPEG family protein [Deltaproteobacteria bacterium]|nr:MAPEG family protein [Deltaproteobacteria bacterium]MDQ3299312.1 MAPEG family protein [Myxococcota bacterium]
MTIDLQLVAYAIVLTWIMVFSASVLKARAWTPAGMKVAFGNRHDVPPPPAFAERADRAGRNMLESLPLFIGLVAVAHLGGRHTDRVDLGAHLFFWARLAYWPIYVVGIPVLRTLVWYVAIAGLGLIFSALL